MSGLLDLSADLIRKNSLLLLHDYDKILQKLDQSCVGDQKIRSNILRQQEQIQRLTEALDHYKKSGDAPLFAPHSLGLDAVLKADEWQDGAISDEVKAWRRDLDNLSYDTIDPENRKEIFDYFFRYDVHGHLDDQATVHLSRGVNDPEYFTPPSIVHIAINAASDNNWFGYSDSLGHVETREAIANLEKLRRIQSNIKPENTAVVMGGTAGLHSVMSMISRGQSGKKCVVASPNYAPIIDDVKHHFEPEKVSLGPNFHIDSDELLRSAMDPDTSVVLLSVPHNPAGKKDYIKILPQLHEACASNGAYLVIDEIIHDEEISTQFDPIRYPNLIVISSYSKAYNIPGLKLGHLLANDAFIDRFYRHASTTYGSPPSFLYQAATVIAEFEKADRQQSVPTIPDAMKTQVSDPDLLYEDFRLWKRHGNINKQFQKFIIADVLDNKRNCSIEGVYGLNDPSPNCIIRMRDGGTAYKTSMSLMGLSNISVMPVECFAPPADWPRDLRVTISVDPEEIATAFPELIAQLDNIHAWENADLWLDDNQAKADVSQTRDEQEIKTFGRAMRRVEALGDIYRIAAAAKPPKGALKQIFTLNQHTKVPVTLDDINDHFTGSQGTHESSELNIDAYLIYLSDRLADVPLPHAKIENLSDIFDVLFEQENMARPEESFISDLNQRILDTGVRL